MKYTDPTGEWFGFDDVFTGPIDEIVILGAMTFYTTLKIYNSEENKKFSDALLESFDYNLECIKILFVNNDKESEIESAEEQNLVIKDSGKPSLSDMKNKPPTHPDYKPPKNWDGRKVKTPDGNGYGWPAKNGDIWQPTDHNGTHAPHWDVQHKNRTHTPVYPE